MERQIATGGLGVWNIGVVDYTTWDSNGTVLITVLNAVHCFAKYP
jgi:hypothetical protein